MEKIEPIKLCCGGLTRTLPLAFDESMSYVELLYAMNNKLTEAINDLNQIIDDYSNIEVNFDEVYNRLNELNNNIIKIKNYTDTLVSNTDSELRRYTKLIVANDITGLNATIENVYTELDDKINDVVIGQIDVYNPTNAQIENINKVLSDIYNINRIYAITCDGFDNFKLTCDAYDLKQITAFDFDNYSLELLSK